jgi:hypothetical protein
MSKFFESYKGRNVLPGQRVEVYRNLKFKDRAIYSVRDAKTGLVLGHASNLLLNRCYFIVRSRGRERVLREKRKNVHAWLEGSFGIIHAGDSGIFSEGYRVTYNPYENESFVVRSTAFKDTYNLSIYKANVVWIDETDVIASGL